MLVRHSGVLGAAVPDPEPDPEPDAEPEAELEDMAFSNEFRSKRLPVPQNA